MDAAASAASPRFVKAGTAPVLAAVSTTWKRSLGAASARAGLLFETATT